MRKLFLLLLSIFSLFLASCSWFNNDALPPSFTVTGKLSTNGAMPENFAQSLNSRTALAPAPEGQTIQYKVLLLAEQGDAASIPGASSTVEEDPVTHELSYSITYTGTSTTPVRYWLRAVAYYMNGSTEVDVLVSPDTQLETAVNLKAGAFIKDLELRPATSGYGTVSLAITLEAATLCDSVAISDNTHFNITKSGTSVTITHKPYSTENTKAASGSYPVTVSFYKSQTINSVATNILVYQFEDVINVFNNLTTNKWVDNGNCPHLTTSSGSTVCSITSAMLADFNATNFYVETGAVSGSGTYINPFNSLAYAIQYINVIGDSDTTYTIHLKGNEETFASSLAVTKKIALEAYSTVPGAKDGGFTISMTSGTAFIINSNGYLSFKSNKQALGTGYPTGATKGIIISGADIGVQISDGKFEMEGGYITCSNSGVWISAPATGKSCIFEMSGGYISGTSGDSSSGGVRVLTGADFKIQGKPVITGGTKGVYLVDGQTIKVVGPLATGALIGVTTSTPPTATENVPITSGYGYQTGGYNAGVLPGNYFRGDIYGVTEDGDPTSGEAVLKLSGGSISTKVRDDITVDIDHTNASNNAADRKFTFTVTKDKGAVAPATSTDLTSAEGISYSYKLKNYADVISNSPTAYYNTSTNTLTFNTNLPQGKYKLEVEVNWDGNKYQAAFDVGYVKTDVPSGCVAVLGSTWNSSTTLCADDDQRKSNFFIAGRNLTIPNLIASDHEVTQAEYEMYMTYSSGSKPTQTSAQKSTYPVYWVNWYSAMIYCNLRTLDDDTFGDTREERLAHCVYSFNGEKDPELWLDSNISDTSIYKSSGKFYNSASSNTTTLQNLEFNMDADGWRLPLDVEWEYLARGGNLLPQNQTPYSGSDSMNEVSWNASNSGDDETSVNPKIHEIKTRKPNNLKIYDMSGNISEWCQDWSLWDGTQNTGIQFDTPITGLTITEAADTIRKSERGGHWGAENTAMTINLHLPSRAFQKYENIGFRVVRTVK